jgi:hypothetical protein
MNFGVKIVDAEVSCYKEPMWFFLYM